MILMHNTKEKLQQSDWHSFLQHQMAQPYYKKIRDFLIKAYDVRKGSDGKVHWSNRTVFPPASDIFNAYILTPLSKVKVVILGQDPYPTPGDAIGLSFSVSPDRPIPASLRNIYKELHDDIGFKTPNHGCLVPWTQQGIMLLNSVLTIGAGKKSHYNIGWEHLTDATINLLSNEPQPVIFILWGAKARKKARIIDHKKNVIIASPHPSPLSAYRGFFGSRPFSKVNYALKKFGKKQINWQLPLTMTDKNIERYFM